jgi:hypothetical protein
MHSNYRARRISPAHQLAIVAGLALVTAGARLQAADPPKLHGFPPELVDFVPY